MNHLPVISPGRVFIVSVVTIVGGHRSVGAQAPVGPAVSSGPQTAVTVPFEFPHNQIVFEVYVGDHGPFNMILDTAVDPSVIDLETAEEVGLSIDRGAEMGAAGVGNDRVPIYPTRIEGLSIGGSSLPGFSAVAMDLHALGEQLGRPLHGALGYSFLSTRAVRIDYPGRRLTVFEGPSPDTGIGGEVNVPLVLHGPMVRLSPVFLNGQPLDLVLDTGASLALTVYDHAAARLGLDSLRASARPGRVRGARGDAGVVTAMADSIRVGDLVLEHLEVAFASRGGVADGLLGNGFLRHFVLTVDYVTKGVRLAPATEIAHDPG